MLKDQIITICILGTDNLYTIIPIQIVLQTIKQATHNIYTQTTNAALHQMYLHYNKLYIFKYNMNTIACTYFYNSQQALIPNLLQNYITYSFTGIET
jgi:hypothetical protein